MDSLDKNGQENVRLSNIQVRTNRSGDKEERLEEGFLSLRVRTEAAGVCFLTQLEGLCKPSVISLVPSKLQYCN